MNLLTFLMLAFAIEHLTDILVNVDLLESYREYFEQCFPAFMKLVRCRFCQAFWFSGVVFMTVPGLFGLDGPLAGIVDAGLSWLVLHSAIVLMTEATERFLGRAASTHNVIHHLPPESFSEQESES